MADVVTTFWQGKKILLTGHTGFKGSWLCLWLQKMGAEVMGYSLDPPTTPSLFESAAVARNMQSVKGDVCDLAHLQRVFAEFAPEIVFHMAAQSLVRPSYENPVVTYQTNVMGTVNVLEATRQTRSVRAIVIITSDKCYENRNWCWGYRENDRLGGFDPYSNSKACAELVVSAFRNSFFLPRNEQKAVALASARAGNVIGGGDWAHDRLIPDAFRAFSEGKVLRVRNPQATRPWQHVLEALRGYLILAQNLYEKGNAYASAWNFGPHTGDARSVRWIVEKIVAAWGSQVTWQVDGDEHPHEAQMLHLDWSKSAQQLGWRPALALEDAVDLTTKWYRGYLHGGDTRTQCLQQIDEYDKKLKSAQH